MILTADLSKRIFQFFDSIYGSNKTDYGFSSDKNSAFMEAKWNQSIRPDYDATQHKNIVTLLYYSFMPTTRGNGIQSNTITYNTSTNAEIINSIKEVEVTIDILSKKYLAKDAMNFFDNAIQSDNRKQSACYGKSYAFDLILYKVTDQIDLSELEKGAWTERVQKKLYFVYEDTLTFEETKKLQTPSDVEHVLDIYQIETNLKKGD